MNFLWTPEEERIRQSFAGLCLKEFTSAAESVDALEAIPGSHRTALSEAGYLGLAFDPAFGGQGRSLMLWACLGEHLARACPSTFASASASSQLFGLMVQMFGTAAQKEKHLPALSSGKLIGAVALTDAKSDSDAGPGLTSAEPAGDGFVLSGFKPYVINGPVCGAALVLAAISPAAENAERGLFIVEAGKEGFSRGDRLSPLGIRGAQTGSLRFTQCVLSKAELLGGGIGAPKALEILHNLECLWWAVFGVGIGQACIDAAVEYATARTVFGKRISKHQEVHMKIAEMHMNADTARLLAMKAAWQIEKGLPDNGVAPAAKVLATEMATRNSHQALQIHGGRGYFKGVPVERMYRDARLGELAGGTSELLRVDLAKGVLKEFGA